MSERSIVLDGKCIDGDFQNINEIRIGDVKCRTGWKYEMLIFSQFVSGNTKWKSPSLGSETPHF